MGAPLESTPETFTINGMEVMLHDGILASSVILSVPAMSRKSAEAFFIPIGCQMELGGLPQVTPTVLTSDEDFSGRTTLTVFNIDKSKIAEVCRTLEAMSGEELEGLRQEARRISTGRASQMLDQHQAREQTRLENTVLPTMVGLEHFCTERSIIIAPETLRALQESCMRSLERTVGGRANTHPRLNGMHVHGQIIAAYFLGAGTPLSQADMDSLKVHISNAYRQYERNKPRDS